MNNFEKEKIRSIYWTRIIEFCVMRSHFFCKPGTCNNQNVTNHRLFGDSGLIKMKKKNKKKTDSIITHANIWHNVHYTHTYRVIRATILINLKAR